MSEPEHTAELKVWFTSEVEAERFLIDVDRFSWANADQELEGSRRGKIATLSGSNAEILGRVLYMRVSWRIGRGFVTKIQMTGGQK